MPTRMPRRPWFQRLFNPEVKTPLTPEQAAQGKQFLSQGTADSPWYLSMANMILLGSIFAFGVIALMSLVGGTAVLASSLPFGIATFATLAVLGVAVGWVAPIVIRRLWPSKKLPSPADPNTLELKRSPFNLSTARGLGWDLRIYAAGMAFAFIAVLIALLVLNPAGLVIGSSIIELIQSNLVILSLVACGAAVLGGAVGAGWRRFAYWYAARYGSVETRPATRPEKRQLFAGSIHDAPIYLRLLGGAMGGAGIATAISLALMALGSGGLGVIPFVSISLGMMVAASAYPYVFYAGKWIREALERHEIISPKTPAPPTEETVTVADPFKSESNRYWFQESKMDWPVYARITIGVLMGLGLAGLAGGGMAFVFAPGICVLLTVASPYVFALVKKPLENLAKRYYRKSDEYTKVFGPTPHGDDTPDMVWYLRSFNGAGSGAAIAGAVIALGGPAGLALGIGIAILFLAVATPAISACLRLLGQDKITWIPKSVKRFFSPKIDIAYNTKRDRHLGYTQWYVRLVIGTLVGAVIGSALAFVSTTIPLAAIAVILSGVFFVVTPKLFKFFFPPKNAQEKLAADIISPTADTTGVHSVFGFGKAATAGAAASAAAPEDWASPRRQASHLQRTAAAARLAGSMSPPSTPAAARGAEAAPYSVNNPLQAAAALAGSRAQQAPASARKAVSQFFRLAYPGLGDGAILASGQESVVAGEDSTLVAATCGIPGIVDGSDSDDGDITTVRPTRPSYNSALRGAAQRQRQMPLSTPEAPRTAQRAHS